MQKNLKRNLPLVYDNLNLGSPMFKCMPKKPNGLLGYFSIVNEDLIVIYLFFFCFLILLGNNFDPFRIFTLNILTESFSTLLVWLFTIGFIVYGLRISSRALITLGFLLSFVWMVFFIFALVFLSPPEYTFNGLIYTLLWISHWWIAPLLAFILNRTGIHIVPDSLKPKIIPIPTQIRLTPSSPSYPSTVNPYPFQANSPKPKIFHESSRAEIAQKALNQMVDQSRNKTDSGVPASVPLSQTFPVNNKPRFVHMDDLPRRKLKEIIQNFGTSVVHNHSKVKGLLLDYCGASHPACTGNYQKEIHILTLSLAQNIPQDLLNTQNEPFEFKRARLQKRLTDLAIEESAAKWALDAWADALGISSENISK
jgi:hypothetical protein